MTKTIEKNPRLLEYLWINKLADNVKVVVVPKGQEGLLLQPGPLLSGDEQEGERTARALSGAAGLSEGK